jgi:hypothetical protein
MAAVNSTGVEEVLAAVGASIPPATILRGEHLLDHRRKAAAGPE